jgi:hypothetical protein
VAAVRGERVAARVRLDGPPGRDGRGGSGEQLLAQNLARVDAEHLPAYLESSNPKNLTRYERLGFHPIGGFTLAAGGPTVTTMWRPAC